MQKSSKEVCIDVSGPGLSDSKSDQFAEQYISVFFIPGLKLARRLETAVVMVAAAN